MAERAAGGAGRGRRGERGRRRGRQMGPSSGVGAEANLGLRSAGDHRARPLRERAVSGSLQLAPGARPATVKLPNLG